MNNAFKISLSPPGRHWQLHPWPRLPCFEPVRPHCLLLRLPDQPCWEGWSWRPPCSSHTPRPQETLWPSPTWPLNPSAISKDPCFRIGLQCQKGKCLNREKFILMSFGFLRIQEIQSFEICMRYILGFVVTELPARETALQSCYLRLPTSQIQQMSSGWTKCVNR